jgi:hypothetical protein
MPSARIFEAREHRWTTVSERAPAAGYMVEDAIHPEAPDQNAAAVPIHDIERVARTIILERFRLNARVTSWVSIRGDPPYAGRP